MDFSAVIIMGPIIDMVVLRCEIWTYLNADAKIIYSEETITSTPVKRNGSVLSTNLPW